jgi:hypothetical protein
MTTDKIYILLVLLFIASWFYTSSDKLAIYGFGIMGLLTFALAIIILINREKVEQGFYESRFSEFPNLIIRAYVFIMVLLFAISIKLVIQVVLQLGRRADTLGSTDLNLSKKSMRILWRFRDTYYVYLIVLSVLLLSFVYNSELITKVKGFKWIQVFLSLVLCVVFFVFADLFVNKEFLKIKNESTKPTKTLVLDTESKTDKKERIGDTSVVRI